VREYVEHENGGKGIEYRKQLAAMNGGWQSASDCPPNSLESL